MMISMMTTTMLRYSTRLDILPQLDRWVVKIGSALLTNEGQGLDADRMDEWVKQMCYLRDHGIEVILVSSGAVASGMVACIDESGDEIARGLANYSAVEASKIIGQPSHQIKALPGYQREPELINRDNMVLS